MAFVVFVPGGGFAGAVLRVVGHAADEFCGVGGRWVSGLGRGREVVR